MTEDPAPPQQPDASRTHLPLSEQRLLALAHEPGGTSPHLLILYALAVGLNAQRIVDIGLGRSTGALRAAAARTGGTVATCDCDRARFGHLLAEQDRNWSLHLEPSLAFLRRLEPPLDLVFHDGAHDYTRVRADLEAIMPKMRTFGLVCVHDTQQPDLGADMLGAVRDGIRGVLVSVTNLPFSAGMALIRVEQGHHPPISPRTGTLPDGRPETLPRPYPTRFVGSWWRGGGIPSLWRRRAGYLRARLQVLIGRPNPFDNP